MEPEKDSPLHEQQETGGDLPEEKPMPETADDKAPETKPTKRRGKRAAPVDLNSLTPKSRKVEEQKIKNRKNSAVWHAKWISKGVPREGQEGNGGEASQQELEGGEASQQELEGGEVAPQNSEPSSASASEPSIDPDMMNEANILV